MQKKPFQKDLIQDRHLPNKWNAYVRKEKKRKEKKTKPKNSDLIKFLTDDNITTHYFLVIINMHH